MAAPRTILVGVDKRLALGLYYSRLHIVYRGIDCKNTVYTAPPGEMAAISGGE